MSTIDKAVASASPNRREQDRVDTNLTVEVLNPHDDGETYTGELLNLSRGGLGLRLDQRMQLRVLWAGQTSPGHTVSVRFRLPVGASVMTVEALCEVVWSKMVSNGQGSMGLQVVEFRADAERILEDYFARLQPWVE